MSGSHVSASSKKMPRAKGHWLLGSAREMRDRPHTFAAELGLRNGGIADFRILHRRMIAVSHPDLLKQIFVTKQDRYERSFHYRASQVTIGKGLLTTDGDYWKLRRRQIQPAFRTEQIRRVVPATHQAVAEMLIRWDERCRAGEPVALVGEMQTLTMTTMCRALLSVGIESAAALRFAQAVRDSLYVVRKRNTSMCPMPLWVHNPTNRALRDTRDILDEFVTGHLEPRTRAGAEKRDDIAQQLLDARDPETGEALPWQAILDETKTLFTAGFETTATTLSWALHRLSQTPEIADEWHEEVDRVCGDATPGWDDLAKLTYTTQIVQETMRLYPPVYSMARACVEEDELGGYRIRPGDTLLASVYGAHLTPEFWAEPMRFDPARFAAGREWTKHAYMPFGMGRHLCIGNQFAMTEVVLALALIGRRYRVRATGPLDVPVRAQITLVPDGEIPVRLEARKHG